MEPEVWKYYLWCEKRQTIALFMANEHKDTFAISYWNQYGQPIGNMFEGTDTVGRLRTGMSREEVTTIWEHLVKQWECKRISTSKALLKFPDLNKIGREMFELEHVVPKLAPIAFSPPISSPCGPITPHGEVAAKVGKAQKAFALSRKSFKNNDLREKG